MLQSHASKDQDATVQLAEGIVALCEWQKGKAVLQAF